MSEQPPRAVLRHCGISPWEIEVAYSYLHSRFRIVQEEIESDESDFVSILHIDIPLPFSEGFFEWFDFRRWENIKALLKEMKRRRGRGNALKVIISFAGSPSVRFVLDAVDKRWYDNALEKIDFVLELLPYHLDPKKLPQGVSGISYRFDEKAKRWRLSEAQTGRERYCMDRSVWRKTA